MRTHGANRRRCCSLTSGLLSASALPWPEPARAMIFFRAALARNAERLKPRSLAASIASSRAASRLTFVGAVSAGVEQKRDHDRAFALADFPGRDDFREVRRLPRGEAAFALVGENIGVPAELRPFGCRLLP
jgi:hypothetical protein